MGIGCRQRRQSVQPNGSVPDIRRRHYENGGRRRIDALDPAWLRGWLPINKSITIDGGGGGGVASVMVSGGATGITVSAGATDIVTIRNVQVQGNLGNGSNNTAGGYGIQFLSGAMLAIDNCRIDGFSTVGIGALTSANAILNVTNTIITNAGDGIGFQLAGGVMNGSIDHTTIQKMSIFGIAP